MSWSTNKVRVNACISPDVSAWLIWEKNPKTGVFEPQSSRCLAYLNERSPLPNTHPPTRVPSPRQHVDWSRKLCVCLYSVSSQSASGWKSTCRDIKGCRAKPPPPLPNGTTLGGELVTDPPIHGFILPQQNALGVAWLGARQHMCCLP